MWLLPQERPSDPSPPPGTPGVSELARKEGKPRALQKNHPSGPKPKDVNSWASALKMNAAQKEAFNILFQKVSKAMKESPGLEDELVDIGRDWGLSRQLAGSMEINTLVKTVAAVSVMGN